MQEITPKIKEKKRPKPQGQWNLFLLDLKNIYTVLSLVSYLIAKIKSIISVFSLSWVAVRQ